MNQDEKQAVAERFAAIEMIATALADALPGDNWHMTHAIKRIASGEGSVADELRALDWDD